MDSGSKPQKGNPQGPPAGGSKAAAASYGKKTYGMQSGLTPAEAKKLEEKNKQKPKGTQLTSMPSKKAFDGAVAYSSSGPGKKRKKPKIDGILAAASRFDFEKDPDIFEAELPTDEDKKSKTNLEDRRKPAAVGKLYTSPKNVNNLVDQIKTMYRGNKAKRRRQSKGDEYHGTGNLQASLHAEANKKETNKDAKIDSLLMKLHGDQVDEMYQFIEDQKETEKELVVQKTNIPKLVAFFWKIQYFYEFLCTTLIMVSVFYCLYASVFRNHVFDVIFLDYVGLVIEIDVILRLIVELWRNRTHCQYEVFAVNYTFFLALCDTIAAFPVIIIYIFAKLHPQNYEASINDIKLLPKFLLLKCFHGFRMTKILNKLEQDLNIRGNIKLILAMIRALIRYLLTIHVISCAIFIIGRHMYMDWILNVRPELESPRQYETILSLRARIHQLDDSKTYPEPLALYLLCLYFVVQTTSTVGLGDFFAVNNFERVATILMMMIGAIWISGELAYILGTFFADIDANRYMMFFRVKSIMIHLQNYQVSNFICKRVENYYRHLWRYRKGIHEIDLSYLPHCVQEELKYDICEELFYKSSIFRGLDETFLMVLAKSVKVALYSPSMILFERGNITKEMYFILQGEVAVAAGLEDDHISAIHRAGCSVGEINLFMAIPHEQTVYTKTPCTLMKITKQDLMLSLQDFPHIFSIIRERVKKRRERYREAFNYVNINPNVQWMYPNDPKTTKCDPDFPVVVRNMKGVFNTKLEGGYMEDKNEQVIIEMPCNVPHLKRQVAKAYRLVSVPRVYYDPGYLLALANVFLMAVWLFISWLTPYCWAFDDFESTYFSGCDVLTSTYWTVSLCAISVLDFAFELFLACPSTGISFKIKDGLAIRVKEPGFYCDLVSIFPYEFFCESWIIPLGRVVLKHWKIIRFWNFLDERFPLKIFFVRLAKMTYYLIYLTYIFGVFFLCIACQSGRGNECNEISFFNPTYPLTQWERVKIYQTYEQYIHVTPLVYAASLLTSVGFGTIFPQTVKELIFTVLFMIIGQFFVSYILAQLTSALSARLTPKLLFHQKLLAVETFVKHNGLSLQLLQKLVQHYDLQHQYVSGCSLPEGVHLMYDAGRSLLEDVFLVEGEIFFEGVPAFSKIAPQAIIDMSRMMRRFVVPPGLVFVRRGEVRRILYVIVNGSVALYEHDSVKASAILTSTGHFGLRDLMFGEPYPYMVKTLGYTTLYALDYSAYQDVLGDDEGLAEYINDEMIRRETEIGVYLNETITNDTFHGEKVIYSPSWIEFPEEPNQPIIGSELTYDHYERPFYYYIGSSFIRENTMPATLHPAGSFGKIWQTIIGLAATVNFICLVTELLIGYTGRYLRILGFVLDCLFCADIYLKLHFGYYDQTDGRLRYHPVKTWSRYIFHGSFFFDIAMMIPLEMIMVLTGSTDIFGYGPGHSWFTKLRCIRVLRCYKAVELYEIVHRIFDNRTTIMFIFYLTIAVIMCYILSAVAYFNACPTFGYTWTKNDEGKMPVCLQNTWVDFKAKEQTTLWNSYKPPGGSTLTIDESEIFHATSFLERFILGLYYVGQILMVIGFGDLSTFRREELYFMLSIALLGFIACQAIISDITSAQIDTDEIRAVNREKLERLAIALTREGAPRYFSSYVRKAFRLAWSYEKGLQPNSLFSDLHPILHYEVLSEYIGDILERVPIFNGFNDAFVVALKAKLKTEYYPKGSAITQYGDLDYRMYIIVKGDVWICDKENRWLCSLSSGESLGDMGLVYAAKRRFTAYAATNVQLLMLEAYEFALLLEKFPLTKKQILTSLLDYKRESYLVKSWKWKLSRPEEYKTIQDKNTDIIRKNFASRLSHIPVRGNLYDSENLKYASDPRWYRRIIGYGWDEITECYLYFLSEDGKFNFVIHPTCKFVLHFRILVQFVRFLSPMIAIFHIAFFISSNLDQKVLVWTIPLGHATDVILWINIVLNFFIAVEVSERQTYCIKLGKIVKLYLGRPLGFWYDVVLAFPYDLIFRDPATLLMLTRCLLSIKFYLELWKLKKDIEVSTMTLKLIISISFLLYFAHIMACMFFTLSCPNLAESRLPGKPNVGKDWIKDCNKNGWVYKFRIEFGKTYERAGISPPSGVDIKNIAEMYEDDDPSHWYLISLYWVMAVVTTCGFGDITPTNFSELVLAVICTFFGSMFLSIMLGNITVGLTSRNKAKREFLGPVETMLEYLEIIGLSNVGRQTLGAYCTMTWNNCRAVNYNDMADTLPLYVQQDVYLALYHNYVTNCLFFGKDYNMSFVRAICPRLRHFMFLPGMRILNEMEPGTGIYIVMRGSVTSFQQNPETGKYDFIKKYEERQAFGRIPALFPGALYNKSYRAEEKTEVLHMYHADMRQLLVKFPRWKIFLRQLISREYSHFTKQTSLKDITKKRLELDEKLSKDLTQKNFTDAAFLYSARPPDRSKLRANQVRRTGTDTKQRHELKKADEDKPESQKSESPDSDSGNSSLEGSGDRDKDPTENEDLTDKASQDSSDKTPDSDTNKPDIETQETGPHATEKTHEVTFDSATNTPSNEGEGVQSGSFSKWPRTPEGEHGHGQTEAPAKKSHGEESGRRPSEAPAKKSHGEESGHRPSEAHANKSHGAESGHGPSEAPAKKSHVAESDHGPSEAPARKSHAAESEDGPTQAPAKKSHGAESHPGHGS